MLFFGMFLRESARTAAKSRTNLSTNSGKATKRLGRLAPNLAHMCKFIWEWIYAKQIALRGTRGHLGVLGGQPIKSLGKLSDWHQLWFTSADSSRNGHTYKSPLNTPGGISGGGGRVSQMQKSGEAVKRLDCLAPNLGHICRSIWEWTYAKQIAPRDTRGVLRVFYESNIQKYGKAVKRLDRLAPTLGHVCGFICEWTQAKSKSPLNTQGAFRGDRGHKLKILGKLSNNWTDWHQIWYTSADSSGNGHILNTSRPSIPQGAFREDRGHKFKILGKVSNRCTDWPQIWYTSADSSGNGHIQNTSRATIPRGHFVGF